MKVLIKRIKEKASKKIFYNCPYVTILTILKSFGWMSEVGSWLALDSYISFYQCSIRYDVSNQKLTSPNHQTIRQDKHRPRHSPFTNICLLALSVLELCLNIPEWLSAPRYCRDIVYQVSVYKGQGGAVTGGDIRRYLSSSPPLTCRYIHPCPWWSL